MTTAPTTTPRCNALSTVVSDMGRTLAFFRLCGLDAPTDATDAPHAEIGVAEGFTLMFDTYESVASFTPGFRPPTDRSACALAIECGSPAEVDAAWARVVEAGHDSHLEPFDAPWGQRYASVRDPDGGSVDLYAPLPA